MTFAAWRGPPGSRLTDLEALTHRTPAGELESRVGARAAQEMTNRGGGDGARAGEAGPPAGTESTCLRVAARTRTRELGAGLTHRHTADEIRVGQAADKSIDGPGAVAAVDYEDSAGVGD